MITKMRDIVKDWPEIRFRPQVDLNCSFDDLFRYDEALKTFIPDDGQKALAFYGRYRDFGHSYPCAWGYEPPRNENVLRRWLLFGIFHLATRQQPTPEAIFNDNGVEAEYRDWEAHPNVSALQKAMDECSRKHSCCNGRVIHMERLLDGEVNYSCAYCHYDGRGHKILSLRDSICSNNFELKQTANKLEEARAYAIAIEKRHIEAEKESVLLKARMEALLT